MQEKTLKCMVIYDRDNIKTEMEKGRLKMMRLCVTVEKWG